MVIMWHLCLPANAGDIRDTGSVPALGRSLGGEHGTPFQYSYSENSRDGGAWWVAKNQTGLSDLECMQLRTYAKLLFPNLNNHWNILREYSVFLLMQIHRFHLRVSNCNLVGHYNTEIHIF